MYGRALKHVPVQLDPAEWPALPRKVGIWELCLAARLARVELAPQMYHKWDAALFLQRAVRHWRFRRQPAPGSPQCCQSGPSIYPVFVVGHLQLSCRPPRLTQDVCQGATSSSTVCGRHLRACRRGHSIGSEFGVYGRSGARASSTP